MINYPTLVQLEELDKKGKVIRVIGVSSNMVDAVIKFSGKSFRVVNTNPPKEREDKSKGMVIERQVTFEDDVIEKFQFTKRTKKRKA